jgi:hypothetical protein
MMPLWTMTLGRLVFTGGDIVVPYVKIATLAAGLVVPLMVKILSNTYYYYFLVQFPIKFFSILADWVSYSPFPTQSSQCVGQNVEAYW